MNVCKPLRQLYHGHIAIGWPLRVIDVWLNQIENKNKKNSVLQVNQLSIRQRWVVFYAAACCFFSSKIYKICNGQKYNKDTRKLCTYTYIHKLCQWLIDDYSSLEGL